MTPTINVSDETLETLNPGVYTLVDTSSHDSDFIYIPSIELHIARKTKFHNTDWVESHRKLQENGERMLTIPEFVEVLRYTKENHRGVYRDITGIKGPWEAEWIDADFKMRGNTLYINSNHIYQNGRVAPQDLEALNKNTLMKNRTPGISLEDWVETSTKQGLPSKKTSAGDLYYLTPMMDNNSVARFGTVSGRSYLDCDSSPSDGLSSLGVRAAKQ